MSFKYGSLLSTAFSASMLMASAVAAPLPDTQILETPTAVMQPVKEAFQNAHMKECALERRRLLYDARSNTLIMTNMAASAHQEVATGRKLEL